MTQSAIQPVFFGPVEAQRYACYEPAPEGAPARSSAILLAQPMGHEYIRCHRAFRQLARMLNEAGFPVMRFDWFGSGDSAGASEDATLEMWLEDLALAVRQLRRMSRKMSIDLVGLRLGATLGLLQGAERGELDRIVAWDPFVRGSEYLETLRAQHAEHEADLAMNLGRSALQDGSPVALEGADEIVGHLFDVRLLDAIEKIDLARLTSPPARHVLWLESENGTHDAGLRTRLEELGVAVDCRASADSRIWLAEPYKALVPHEALGTVVKWLQES